MTEKTELSHDGEFILSEWDLKSSREEGVLITGQNLEAGSVVGLITASTKYTFHDPDAATGEEVVAGIIWNTVDATAADKDCVVVVRGPITVNEDELIFEGTMTAPEIVLAKAALNALGIVVVV